MLYCLLFTSARCERAGEGEVLAGFSSSSDEDDEYDHDRDVQLDDVAGAQNERRDVARLPTTTTTSLKHPPVAASATCRMSTELVCFNVVVVVGGMSSFLSSLLRTSPHFVSVH